MDFYAFIFKFISFSDFNIYFLDMLVLECKRDSHLDWLLHYDLRESVVSKTFCCHGNLHVVYVRPSLGWSDILSFPGYMLF